MQFILIITCILIFDHCNLNSHYISGTTLAQNFPKLAQLCDLHGKSHMLECVS